MTILLLLFTIPFLYKYFFWLYVFQLKEYRFDRTKEYLETPQWKKALLPKTFFLELFLFFALIFYTFSDGSISTYTIFLIFLSLNIFYLFKISKKNYFLPKFTFRSLLIVFVSLLLLVWIFYFLPKIVLFLAIVPYLLIIISNILTLPLIIYKKNKFINKAILKSKSIKKPIKIWITWSYWKSSVKEYLAFLLWNIWKTLSTPENINTEMWVSSIILNKLDDKYDYFVAEMWAYRIWEIKALWEIVNHKYWFLTAIWTQHIWLFWSQENIKKGKSEIALKVLENNWILYVNWDNENIKNTNFSKKLKIVKYWISEDCHAFSKIIWFKDNFLEFKFNYKEQKYLLKTNLLWEHNIINLTWILAFLIDIWIDINLVKHSLLNLPNPKHTLDVIKNWDLTIIDDTYNLSVDWLLAWIETLKYFEWKKILILDDILELWKDSEKIHYDLWKKIWDLNIFENILFIWTNYKENFIKWLINSSFKKENILNDLSGINSWILLFEWRWARKYIDI